MIYLQYPHFGPFGPGPACHFRHSYFACAPIHLLRLRFSSLILS